MYLVTYNILYDKYKQPTVNQELLRVYSYRRGKIYSIFQIINFI